MKYKSKSADEEIGLKIKKRRKALKMTQTELADEVGVSFQQVQKYENGQSRLFLSNFITICNSLKVDPGDLLESTSFCDGDVGGDKDSDIDLEQKLLSVFRSIESSKFKARILSLVEAVVTNFNDDEETN